MKAVLDANVLFPAPLRDLWMRLAVVGTYAPHWTDQIHDEWTRNVLRDRPDIPQEQLERTRRLMDVHAPGAKVAGYGDRIPTLELPDPQDRHVLAAALHSGAEVIVTFNLKDFPRHILEPLGVLAQHPDAFALDQWSLHPDKVIEAVSQQRRALRSPLVSAQELLETVRVQRLERFAAALQAVKDRV